MNFWSTLILVICRAPVLVSIHIFSFFTFSLWFKFFILFYRLGIFFAALVIILWLDCYFLEFSSHGQISNDSAGEFIYFHSRKLFFRVVRKIPDKKLFPTDFCSIWKRSMTPSFEWENLRHRDLISMWVGGHILGWTLKIKINPHVLSSSRREIFRRKWKLKNFATHLKICVPPLFEIVDLVNIHCHIHRIQH